MELENIILSEVSQAQKTSYADFRSRASAAMWLDLDHMTKGKHIRVIEKYVENPKHESI
jgi:hypothetical protein